MIDKDEKISRAKSKLLVEYPYFGALASKLKLEVNDNIESFKSDGKKLYYREEYINSLAIDEVEFILANGAMHTVLAYERRKNSRSGWLWQMATDISINSMLLQNGMSMPDGAEYRKRFDGMYAEEIYAELKEDILRDELSYESDDIEDTQDLNDTNKESIEDEILQEQLLVQEAISLLEKEFKKGQTPNSIERFFKLDFLSKVDWRSELRLALEKYFRDDYTLLPPSKKLLSYGIYLPSTTSVTYSLVIGIDSSASIDEENLSRFLSEVNSLMSLIQNYTIELIVCDDKIRYHKTFYSGDILELELIGGGATDFRPVFEYIDTELDDIKLLLYFTDLDGIFPDTKPDYEVKWVSKETKNIPFGSIIEI
jgi:predicted metal-dependent peptidase